MKFNRDGTAYSLDTVVEDLENRFMKNEWADVSDLLGSDWAATRAPRTSKDYQTAAFAVAQLIYTQKQDDGPEHSAIAKAIGSAA